MNNAIRAQVSPNDKPAANTLCHTTPLTRIFGSSKSPKITRLNQPAEMPRAWPIKVFLGLEAGSFGEKKNKNAVGPRDGKTKGFLLHMAMPPIMHIETKPFTIQYMKVMNVLL